MAKPAMEPCRKDVDSFRSDVRSRAGGKKLEKRRRWLLGIIIAGAAAIVLIAVTIYFLGGYRTEKVWSLVVLRCGSSV